MPLSAHFLAVTPDGCPEEIQEGPYTKEQADDALFRWEMNHGCPARVVCLGEAVEPTKFAVALTFNNDERFVHLGAFRHAGSREQANHYAEESARAGGHPVIYGLVPVES